MTKVVTEFARLFEDNEHTTFVEQVLDPDIFPRADEIDDDDELHADILDDEGKVWSKSH